MSEIVKYSKEEAKDVNLLYQLTKRQVEIFLLVGKGYKSNEIARELFITELTVATHRKKIKKKLQLNSIVDWYQLYNNM